MQYIVHKMLNNKIPLQKIKEQYAYIQVNNEITRNFKRIFR